jgi:hypothetical protein
MASPRNTLPCNSNQQPDSARRPVAITPAAADAPLADLCLERFGQPGHHAAVLSKMKIVFNSANAGDGVDD